MDADRTSRTLRDAPTPTTTVLLTRFEDLVSLGLRALVEDDPTVTLAADGVEIDALEAALATFEPTVVVLNFGSLRSPADVRRFHAAHPDVRLVVLANRPTAAEANQMLAFGANACLSKDTEARDVLNAIHLASRGLQLLPKKLPAGPAAHHPVGPELLTPREADVLEHLQRGRSNAEIALALHVGVETVRTHRRNIYRKLGVRRQSELTGLVTPRHP
jgi:DNA-binding NarL/FixJ family response regulator